MTKYGILTVLIILGIGVLWFFGAKFSTEPASNATSTPVTSVRSISDGTMAFTFDTNEFKLALTPEQILVSAYIPPCDKDFTYCIYFATSTYTGTNFESAGLRIKKRVDLVGDPACLETPPLGFAEMTPTIATSSSYSTSIFSPLGDAGAGHYASGELYRLAVASSCYEFETRVGATQYANYEPGAIKEFTVADDATIRNKLVSILGSVTLSSNQTVVFPTVSR